MIPSESALSPSLLWINMYIGHRIQMESTRCVLMSLMINLKKRISDLPILGSWLVKIYRYIFPRHDLTYWIAKYMPAGEAMVVQIGSNDGKTGDPIFDLIQQHVQWKAIFIEPVPYLFEQLKKNYGPHPRFTFENAAINEGCEQTFFTVKQEAKDRFPDLPEWYDQLGSFNRINITKELNGILEPFIEEIQVAGMSLLSLFRSNSVDTIDLLHIDTEGYDWKIIRQLSSTELQPAILLYEHKLLSETDTAESIRFLEGAYFIFDFGDDFFCLRRDILQAIDLQKLGVKLVNKMER